MLNTFSQFGRQMLTWIYPPQCACCGEMVTVPHTVCQSCEEGLHWLPAELRETRFSRPNWDKVYSSLAYEGKVSAAVLHYKYAEELSLVPIFSQWLMFHGEKAAQADVLVPVPLGKKKLADRGFSQTLLLADALAKKIRKPVLRHTLQRVQEPEHAQVELTAAEREKSVFGNFAVRAGKEKALLAKRVLLLDDVFTTGATVNECSKVLKQAGAAEVMVLTLARRL